MKTLEALKVAARAMHDGRQSAESSHLDAAKTFAACVRQESKRYSLTTALAAVTAAVKEACPKDSWVPQYLRALAGVLYLCPSLGSFPARIVRRFKPLVSKDYGLKDVNRPHPDQWVMIARALAKKPSDRTEREKELAESLSKPTNSDDLRKTAASAFAKLLNYNRSEAAAFVKAALKELRAAEKADDEARKAETETKTDAA